MKPKGGDTVTQTGTPRSRGLDEPAEVTGWQEGVLGLNGELEAPGPSFTTEPSGPYLAEEARRV